MDQVDPDPSPERSATEVKRSTSKNAFHRVGTALRDPSLPPPPPLFHPFHPSPCCAPCRQNGGNVVSCCVDVVCCPVMLAALHTWSSRVADPSAPVLPAGVYHLLVLAAKRAGGGALRRVRRVLPGQSGSRPVGRIVSRVCGAHICPERSHCVTTMVCALAGVGI